MKYQDKDIIYMGNNKMLLYSRFDMGGKYKVYTRSNAGWRYYGAFSTIGEAYSYYEKIYDGGKM